MDLNKKLNIKHRLEIKAGYEKADEIWNRAKEILPGIEKKYSHLPKITRVHLSRILPSAAIQLAAKEITGNPELGYNAIAEASWAKCVNLGNKIKQMTRIPGFNNFFIKMWNPLCKKVFGPKAGFKNVFYPKKKGEYRMDIVECPYYRIFTELGTPELTKIFCINDEYMYGDLPGIEFKRTSTLGKGGDKCDFCLRLKNKKI